MISVTYMSNLREQVRAARAINRGQVSTWSLLALIVAFPLASGVWGLATEGLTADVGQLFALAAAGCALWYLFPWFPVWVVRRGVRTPDGPVTVAFSEAGILTEGPNGKAESTWEPYLKTRETPEFLLLYYGKSVAVPLPKRVFTPEQLLELRELVSRRVGSRHVAPDSRLQAADGGPSGRDEPKP
jgi:hypothetical protein